MLPSPTSRWGRSPPCLSLSLHRAWYTDWPAPHSRSWKAAHLKYMETSGTLLSHPHLLLNPGLVHGSSFCLKSHSYHFGLKLPGSWFWSPIGNTAGICPAFSQLLIHSLSKCFDHLMGTKLCAVLWRWMNQRQMIEGLKAWWRHRPSDYYSQLQWQLLKYFYSTCFVTEVFLVTLHMLSFLQSSQPTFMRKVKIISIVGRRMRYR